MISWPVELIKDIARRKSVIYIGSGVSMNSVNRHGRRPKTWASLLEEMLAHIPSPKKHISKILKENDYLTACEIIKKKLGKERFVGLLRDEYLNPGYIPADIHKNIFNLDSRIVISPNFDKIYDTYVNTQTNGSTQVKNHYDDDVQSAIKESGRLIIKAHGTIDTPEKLIFTRKEYAEARSKYNGFYEILQALAITHNFIFIGCGVNDPDIRLLLEDTFFKHGSYKSHYFILAKGAIHNDQVDIIENTMNAKVINYSKNNDHEELTLSLEGLVTKVNEYREQLREDGNW
ncbi:SIR2 family protein [Enterobacteriaceae bacterium H20N1]|uniref:SIR2 family protein n=1 Tax=Dryocola boscaweniae TaxID=2925397 RepID=A0A9X2WBU0_9ENTR|nr:SIR2 family protein [Dryocola boscaweniae]MCT4703229.1 SIR2 family protein [Dryocola boscaweniae]MCT4720397.1 SIR2 family protein [Dryocola boscaweniae]